MGRVLVLRKLVPIKKHKLIFRSNSSNYLRFLWLCHEVLWPLQFIYSREEFWLLVTGIMIFFMLQVFFVYSTFVCFLERTSISSVCKSYHTLLCITVLCQNKFKLTSRLVFLCIQLGSAYNLLSICSLHMVSKISNKFSVSLLALISDGRTTNKQ